MNNSCGASPFPRPRRSVVSAGPVPQGELVQVPDGPAFFPGSATGSKTWGRRPSLQPCPLPIRPHPACCAIETFDEDSSTGAIRDALLLIGKARTRGRANILPVAPSSTRRSTRTAAWTSATIPQSRTTRGQSSSGADIAHPCSTSPPVLDFAWQEEPPIAMSRGAASRSNAV